ncbi:MAG TPA: 2OG-Fe(II) oxygenase [Acidimicrobiales bacterium]|nr:2OG-Fe(II) oxygenase [Acidimicrobiales bacterium]
MTGTVLDIDRLTEELPELRARYGAAAPFPHIVLDDFLTPEAAKGATAEFPPLDTQWNTYSHANERKFSHTDPSTWGPTLQAVLAELQSDEFVAFLGGLTGIDGLMRDDALEGGGLHQSVAGGFLNIHADFTVHPAHRHWRRRVNLLLYLNEDWRPEYGGDLELWRTDMSKCERSVAPIGNRAVIFTTDADSFHGHPEPMTCPPGLARQSLALYYFTEEERPVVRSTEYRARPGDGARAVVIYLDKQALRGFDWARRHLGVSGRSAERLLGSVERLTQWRHNKRGGGGSSGRADGHQHPHP